MPTSWSPFLAVDCAALPWRVPERPADRGEQRIRYRTIFQGGEQLPQVHMTEYAPGWRELRHRHLQHEVLMLYEGELEIEGVLHKAPSVIYVSRGTLYGPLTAGADGAKFFRLAYDQQMLFPAAQAALGEQDGTAP